ncbi:MAG: NUDIX hydrolase [Clostridia bacterium]|nr:NUDIX hydrolase [Clostridia bacterium]
MSDYILDLRRQVGHRLLMQVGVSVIIVDKRGRILLQQRTDNHTWGYAGGSAEPDEEVESGARREMLEETGLSAKRLELFGIYSGRGTHYIYPNGDEISTVDLVYECRDYTGELKCQPGEVDRLEYFAAENIPDNIHPPHRQPLLDWISKNRQKQY